MKILNFTVQGMHGYQNISLDFNSDITFLVGTNGSGKTSALRLLQAALAIVLLALSSIRFTRIEITIIRVERHHILINHEGPFLSFALDGAQAETKIALPADDERSVYQNAGRLSNYMEELRIRFLKESSPRFREFSNQVRPLFLGLERRTGRYDDEGVDDEILFRSKRVIGRSNRDAVEGIDNCQMLIERAYRHFRRTNDLNSSRTINFIVESLFDYIEFDHSMMGSLREQQELQILLERRQEIERFSSDLGGGSRASQQISRFFSRISRILENNSETGDALSIELLLNKAQIQRIIKILAEMDRQKKQSEKYYAPIKEIIDTLNEFFNQSRKTVDVDSVGKIKVSHRGVQIPLEHLSSGEKQLLILLTHAHFSPNRGGVFIVDEPELSLHMRWQEMLVDSLLRSKTNNQFIVATHSPEIVGFRKDNCLQVG